MSRNPIIEELEAKQLKDDVCDFEIGDTVKVTIRIIEGDKERTQMFTGTVIARKGAGINETFSLHRVAYGSGMERVFLLHSPRVANIEVVRKGKVRRSKLYYLRGTSGKKARVKERIVKRK
jgi:large subunit ribosomal protein L19